jgi:hypothetical protein
MPQMNTELKLAVLIDADNVPYSNVKGMMEEITKYGTPTTKRIMPIGRVRTQMDGRMYYWSTPSLLFSNTAIPQEKTHLILH